MKEATGELNMTVVTVVAIAAIAAFFYAFVWPAIKNNITSSTRCSQAVCSNCTVENGKRRCTDCSYVDENGATQNGLTCVFNDTTHNNPQGN